MKATNPNKSSAHNNHVNESRDSSNITQINQPEVFKKVYSHFQFVPGNLNSIDFDVVINLNQELNLSEIHIADRLEDGTIFIAGSELPGKMFFIYLNTNGRPEVISYPGKSARMTSLSKNKDYLWFFEDCNGIDYQFKAYDIIHRKVYDARDLLKNWQIFEQTANNIMHGQSTIADKYKNRDCFLSADLFSYGFYPAFTSINEMKIQLIATSLETSEKKQTIFTLPPLSELIMLKDKGTPFEVAHRAITSLSEADWKYRLNPNAALTERKLIIEGSCIKNLPPTNVEAMYGLPHPVQTSDGKYGLIPFHYYLNPKTMLPSELGYGSASTAESARFTGMHLINTIDTCLKKSYVHGIGVIKAIFQYKNYLFTSIYNDDKDQVNHIAVWNLNTDQSIFTLNQDTKTEIVEFMMFDEKNKEVIGAVKYPAKIIKWKVPGIF